MSLALATLTLLVDDQDRALDFFTRALGFAKLADEALPDGGRWLLVGTSGKGGGARLLLAMAQGEEERTLVGRQAAGRVLGILHSADFDADHARMRAAGVRFLEAPRDEPYGRVAIFADCCGNRWDLLQPA